MVSLSLCCGHMESIGEVSLNITWKLMRLLRGRKSLSVNKNPILYLKTILVAARAIFNIANIRRPRRSHLWYSIVGNFATLKSHHNALLLRERSKPCLEKEISQL